MKSAHLAASLSLAVAVLFAGCSSAPVATTPYTSFGAPPATFEPLNLSTAKADVLAYVDSGGYQRDLIAAAAPAKTWIVERAANRRPGERLAVVFDIDETVLSNLPVMRAEDFGYNPSEWETWIDTASAPAIEPVREVYLAARAADVAVLFLTGRRDPSERRGTEKNLRRAGLGDYAALRLAPADAPRTQTARERKTAARAAWAAEGWTIIATIGDQESDVLGGHAERGFKLPNPFYLIP